MPMSNAPASTPLQPAPPSATNQTSGPLAAKPVGTGPTSPSSSSLVEALRETVRDAPPTVVLRSGGGEAAMEAATSMKGYASTEPASHADAASTVVAAATAVAV
jgi:hypothetical protein